MAAYMESVGHAGSTSESLARTLNRHEDCPGHVSHKPLLRPPKPSVSRHEQCEIVPDAVALSRLPQPFIETSHVDPEVLWHFDCLFYCEVCLQPRNGSTQLTSHTIDILVGLMK
jgi:hypothetical protein